MNASELLINVVIGMKPKLLTGFHQKVCGRLLRFTFGVRHQQHHRRKGSTYPFLVNNVELGKPVVVPPIFCGKGAGAPQGNLLRLRVEEDGKSECRSVTERILI